VNLLAWFLGATVLLVTPLSGDLSVRIVGYSTVGCVAFGILSFLSHRILDGIRDASLGRVREYFGYKIDLWFCALGRGFVRWNQIIAPTGWEEINISIKKIENFLSPMIIFRGYALLLTFLPIFVSMMFVWTYSSGDEMGQRMMGLVGAYNLLVASSSLTVGILVSVLVLKVLTIGEVLLVRPNVKNAIQMIATYAGYGTVMGFVTAVLVPFMGSVMASDASNPVESFSFLSPQLLIDLPATGAILGYILGLLRSSVELLRAAENLFVRRMFSPILGIVSIATLVHVGYGPQGIMRQMIMVLPKPEQTVCFDNDLIMSTTSDTGLLSLLGTCSVSPFTIGDETFVVLSAVTLFFFALRAVIQDARKSGKTVVA
ncbi:hypothetical protein, partial [Glutamicibacter sp. AOP3-A1-12]